MGDNYLKKIQFITLTSILLLLLIVIPTGFAANNETVIADGNETMLTGGSEDILSDEYYFDASVDNDDGDGSIYNPYQKLTPYRVKSDSINHLDSGVYDFNNGASFKNVTMIGASPADTIVKNAVIASSDNLVLYNLTFVDSTFIVENEFTAINCIFTNSTSKSYGAVIYPSGDNMVKITLDGCTFSNNDAVCGGAIYIIDGTLNIKNSVFINNTAKLFGGAIAAVRSSLSLENITARNNKAGADGGVVYSLYGNFKMYDSTIVNNQADKGAGVFVDGADYDIIINNRFIDNVPLVRASLYSFYNSNSTITDNEYSSIDDLCETFDLDFIGNGNYSMYNYISDEITDIPSRYDLRELGQVTPVKNQGNDGNCWAFATIATLESCILKALGDNYDLSESNMKNLFGLYSDYGWDMETNKGGYASSGYNYLISWLGPVLEQNDPYIVGTIFSKVLNSLMHVQNVMFIQRSSFTDNDEIKKALMKYGAVYTPIYAKFDGDGKQYYTGDKSANHAIVIVGWDDDMEFSGAPGKGGWIIKNSWGANWRGSGYGYVSYYDKTCVPIGKVDSVFTFILNDTIKYDKNYQYDVQGKSDFFYNSSASVWYKNKFTATDNEYLTAVSTMFDKKTSYTFSVYVNDELKLTQSGTTNPGYYTFNLNEVIPLSVGDEFVVVFHIAVDREAGVPISEKVSFNKYYYKKNTSFISYDGVKWADLYDLYWTYTSHTYNSAVACIKAFTTLNPINTSVKLDIDNIGHDSLDLVANVFNEWGHAVKYGSVIFNVSGTEYSVSLNNGVARLSGVHFAEGINNFTATFSTVGYLGSTNYILFANDKINTTITFNDVREHNVVNISAVVRDADGNVLNYGYVIFNIEGKNHTVSIVDGIAAIDYTFSNLGMNNITAYYVGDYLYGKSNVTKTIIVSLYETVISLNQTGEYNPIIITANVTDENGKPVGSGYVIFVVDGTEYPANVVDGKANFTNIFTHIGVNNISAYYYDDSFIYNSSKTSKMITVSQINTKLQIIVSENANNPVDIEVLVNDQFDNPVDSGEVTFNMDGKTTTVKVSNGIAKITHVFTKTGNNSISVSYNDNSYKYNSSSANSSVNVSKINVEMSMRISDNVNITVELSQPINEYTYLLIDNKVYKQKLADGKCTFSFNNLKCGINRVVAYLDSYIYECKNQSGEFPFYYTSQISLLNQDLYHGGAFTVILSDVYNKILIKNHIVKFIINNHVFQNTTDKNGRASVHLNLTGKYDIEIRFEGDDEYKPYSVNTTVDFKSTIVSGYEVKTLNSQYEFKLIGCDGKPLANEDVTVKIGSANYELTSDKNGIVKLDIDLKPASYVIEITNPVSGEIKSQNIKVVSRISGNKALTMYYGAGKYYKVKALDDDGKIAKGVKVKFTINGRTYTRTTDSKGYASIKISTYPGKYTITAEYKGFKVSNKITVKSTIISKNINVKKGKTIKFTVKLVNKNGKILKNKKITFKFKGKTYNVKTNKYGKATLKITKKYNKGTYTISSKYGKLTIKNKIRIN